MSIRIGIGSGIGLPAEPELYWEWIRIADESGIDSIWHSDQLVGANIEPMAMLAALAARTKRLRFGTNALVVAFRDPILVAKQFAAIDWLAPGRLLPTFGVGGAQDPYWAATGEAPGPRGKRSNEAIRLIRALLEQDELNFAGDFYRYEGPGSWPRPAKPLPLWIGGHSEAAIQRTAALGDGWLGGLVAPDQAADAVARIKTAVAEQGRSIDVDHYGVTIPYRIGEPDDPAVLKARERLRARLKLAGDDASLDLIAAGDAASVAALFRRYVAAGIHKFVAVPMAENHAELIDQTRLLAAHVLPAVEDRAAA